MLINYVILVCFCMCTQMFITVTYVCQCWMCICLCFAYNTFCCIHFYHTWFEFVISDDKAIVRIQPCDPAVLTFRDPAVSTSRVSVSTSRNASALIRPHRCRADAKFYDSSNIENQRRRADIYRTMHDVQTVFDFLGTPAFLSDGPVLAWYRNCSTMLDDIDYSVHEDAAKSPRLMEKMIQCGFQIGKIFGNHTSPGFQFRVYKYGVQVRM
jgi:hypothetical protein